MRISPVVRISVAVALVGCDPGFVVQGVVRDSSGARIPGVDVALVCDRVRQTWTTSDADGRFRTTKLGFYDDDCVITVQAPGRDAETFSIMRHCTKRYQYDEDKCSEVTIPVTLP